MPFVSSETHIFRNKILQLPVHIFKIIMNGWYLSSIEFIWIKVVLTIYGLSLNRHFVAKDSLKLNNAINTSLIRLNIILFYS